MSTVVVTTNYRNVVTALRIASEEVVKKVVVSVVDRLVAPVEDGGTPVKTGFARSNWLVNVGSPVLGVIGSPRNVVPHPDPRPAIAAYKLRDGDVYITNNVHYVNGLNEGNARVAPKGFVQLAIGKAINDDL